MAYSTPTDVRNETFFKDTTNILDSLITQKIAEADKLINSMIARVYVLPLSYTPDIIVNISKKIAAIYLYKDQSTNIEIQPGLTTKEEWAIQLDILKTIQKRGIILADANEVELPLKKAALPQGYPNLSSSATPVSAGGTAPVFKMGMQW